jgi:hypothetical protein
VCNPEHHAACRAALADEDVVGEPTSTWSFSGAGIEAIPGNVRTWVNNAAVGKTPWQEPADAAAG